MNNWTDLNSAAGLQQIIEASATKPQIIFKDSLTCGISAHAKSRLQQGFQLLEGKADFHHLDLLQYRAISNLVAQTLGITHQSPQIIVLRDGKAVYSSSHHAIDAADIARKL